jgi:Lipase (class 3)
MFNAKLALELLDLSGAAQFTSSATISASTGFTGPISGLPARLCGEEVKAGRSFAKSTTLSDTEGFVAHNESGDVVLAFRGSETGFKINDGAWRDWLLTDLRANRAPYPPAPKSWPDTRWVHAGIWEAYATIRSQLYGLVRQQFDFAGRRRGIYVTGFSLGGSLAHLAAIDLAKDFHESTVVLYAFAAPRVGDASLNRYTKDWVSERYFTTLEGDPVPRLPPVGPNFPITTNSFNVNIAGTNLPMLIGLPNFNAPLTLQFGQNYVNADEVVYITPEGRRSNHLPIGDLGMNFLRHNFQPYFDAIKAYERRVGSPEKPAPVPMAPSEFIPVLHSML